MAGVPAVDFGAFSPEGSARPGGPGLEAAARRYFAKQKQAETGSVATTLVDEDKEAELSDEKSKPEKVAEEEEPQEESSKETGKENSKYKKGGIWHSMKRRMSRQSSS